MAGIIDDATPISITIEAQGYAFIDNVTATPNPALPGQTVTITPTIINQGNNDIIWRKVYKDEILSDTQSTTLSAGATWAPSPIYNFTMGNENVAIKIEAGHIVGVTEILDSTFNLIVTKMGYPEAVFIGTITYDPGQLVEPGTLVTITYQIQNTGSTGLLWGGLYDNATPNPNLIAGYWEQNVNNGEIITKTVSITVNENLSAQLLCGHFE